MSTDWLDTTLGEVLELKRGYDLPKKKRTPGDVPIISSSGESDSHTEAKVKGPGVVTGRYGTIGQVFYSEDDFWPLNTTLYVRDFKGNDEKFIYYFLKTIDYQQYSDKAAVPGVNRNHLHLAKVRIPNSLQEQRNIADFLSALDNKIELNRQINATLESMAQALFKSWFVDFDPVIDNALAAGNPIPEPLQARADKRAALLAAASAADTRSATDNTPPTQTAPHTQPGTTAPATPLQPLPADLRALFPDSFVFDEEMGWVPEGWSYLEVKDLCFKIQNGGTPKRDVPEYWEGGDIPWLASGEVRKPIVIRAEQCITELGLANSSAKMLRPLSTVVAMYGATAGEVSFISEGLTTNQAVCGLMAKEGFEYFVYLAMERISKHLSGQARGSAQQNISKGIVETTIVVGPELHSVLEFNKIASPLFSKWIENLKQIESLSELRDTLLPKLLSGQIQLAEAKNIAAEAQ